MKIIHSIIYLLLLSTSMTVMAQHQQATGNEAYTDIYKEYTDDPEVHIYTSYIDYTDLATQITAGCTDDYQRVRAIYEWVCKNIDYDLSKSIHRADSCLMMLCVKMKEYQSGFISCLMYDVKKSAF